MIITVITIITTVMGVLANSLLEYHGNILVRVDQRKPYVYKSSCRVLQQIRAAIAINVTMHPNGHGFMSDFNILVKHSHQTLKRTK